MRGRLPVIPLIRLSFKLLHSYQSECRRQHNRSSVSVRHILARHKRRLQQAPEEGGRHANKANGTGLSDSNRTILDAKELHLVPQWVERCLGRRRLMRHYVRGLDRRLLPDENLSDCRRHKYRLINLLWTKTHETRQKRMHWVNALPRFLTTKIS